MLRTCHLAFLCFLCSLLFLSSGCTKTIFHQTTLYSPGQSALIEPLPTSGLWSIKLADEKGKLHTIASDRILDQGTLAGFETDRATHILYALAGDQRFPLNTPANARGNLIWFSRLKLPSHLSREFGKVLDAAEPALKATAAGAAIAGEAYLESTSDDCKDDPNNRPLHRHH